MNRCPDPEKRRTTVADSLFLIAVSVLILSFTFDADAFLTWAESAAIEVLEAEADAQGFWS